MDLRVVSATARDVEADWLIVGVPEGSEWPSELGALDSALQGQLSRMREAGDLTGKLAFTPQSVPEANTRMRLAETQTIIAVARMSDGSFFIDQKQVKVTIGGCGG